MYQLYIKIYFFEILIDLYNIYKIDSINKPNSLNYLNLNFIIFKHIWTFIYFNLVIKKLYQKVNQINKCK